MRKRDTKHKITAEPFPFGANDEKEEKKVISHIPGGEDEGGGYLGAAYSGASASFRHFAASRGGMGTPAIVNHREHART